MTAKKILILLAILCFLPLAALADLEVYFLDVGQGDSTLILCDGEYMINDGGPPSVSSYLYTFIREKLKLDHMDYLISTHPHEDHIGGLPAVLNAVPVNLILSPVDNWDTKRFQTLLEYADAQGAPLVVPTEGDALKLGGALVTVLHCWPDAWSTNDMSIVTRIDYGETSLIITGDAENMSEYMMIDSGADLRADVLRIAHHGSYTASSREFLDAVNADYAVISVGAGNGYGHPHQETLDKLRYRKVEVFRTDLQGTIKMWSDGDKIVFTTERETNADVFRAPTGG